MLRLRIKIKSKRFSYTMIWVHKGIKLAQK